MYSVLYEHSCIPQGSALTPRNIQTIKVILADIDNWSCELMQSIKTQYSTRMVDIHFYKHMKFSPCTVSCQQTRLPSLCCTVLDFLTMFTQVYIPTSQDGSCLVPVWDTCMTWNVLLILNFSVNCHYSVHEPDEILWAVTCPYVHNKTCIGWNANVEPLEMY